MKYTIYLFDPSGGGFTEKGNMIVVHSAIIREVGKFAVDKARVLRPGELLVTQPALDRLGESQVFQAFINHLLGNWWSRDPDDNAENEAALENGGTIYNVDMKRRIMCITYPGDNTTLITSEEY